jgi:hypothetical protein
VFVVRFPELGQNLDAAGFHIVGKFRTLFTADSVVLVNVVESRSVIVRQQQVGNIMQCVTVLLRNLLSSYNPFGQVTELDIQEGCLQVSSRQVKPWP